MASLLPSQSQLASRRQRSDALTLCGICLRALLNAQFPPPSSPSPPCLIDASLAKLPLAKFILRTQYEGVRGRREEVVGGREEG